MTIEVFKFLNEKLSKKQPVYTHLDNDRRKILRPDNTSYNKTENRKRSAEESIQSEHVGNKIHIPNTVNQEMNYIHIVLMYATYGKSINDHVPFVDQLWFT